VHDEVTLQALREIVAKNAGITSQLAVRWLPSKISRPPLAAPPFCRLRPWRERWKPGGSSACSGYPCGAPHRSSNETPQLSQRGARHRDRAAGDFAHPMTDRSPANVAEGRRSRVALYIQHPLGMLQVPRVFTTAEGRLRLGPGGCGNIGGRATAISCPPRRCGRPVGHRDGEVTGSAVAVTRSTLESWASRSTRPMRRAMDKPETCGASPGFPTLSPRTQTAKRRRARGGRADLRGQPPYRQAGW